MKTRSHDGPWDDFSYKELKTLSDLLHRVEWGESDSDFGHSLDVIGNEVLAAMGIYPPWAEIDPLRRRRGR